MEERMDRSTVPHREPRQRSGRALSGFGRSFAQTSRRISSMKDAHDLLLRAPPQNLEAEQSVLGAIFLNSEVALGYVMEILTTDDFYRESHRTIFRAMIKLYEMKTPIDAITLTAELRGSGQLEAIGGPAYIAELPVIVPTP